MVGEHGRSGQEGQVFRRGLDRPRGMGGGSGISGLESRQMGVFRPGAPNSGIAGGLDIAVGRSVITMVKMRVCGPWILRVPS